MSRTSSPFGLAPAIVFTGTMDYRPNVEAVTWFAQEVLPILRRRDPAPEFHIVGANPAPAVAALAALRAGLQAEADHKVRAATETVRDEVETAYRKEVAELQSTLDDERASRSDVIEQAERRAKRAESNAANRPGVFRGRSSVRVAEGGSGSNKEIWLPYHVERLADPRKAQRGLDRRNVIFSPKGRCHIQLTNVRSSG